MAEVSGDGSKSCVTKILLIIGLILLLSIVLRKLGVPVFETTEDSELIEHPHRD